ncbi:MAG: type III pantothenate kinase [Clostridiales bacterium]|nr:type III pantothenate kinase [Clostridiales bacterium]
MLLVMDIGNSNLKVALFRASELVNYWRVSTNNSYSSDEYGIILDGMFRHAGRNLREVTGIMVSSVVPTINFTIDHMCREYFKIEPMFVGPGIKTGINILYESPRDLGADRICNAVAAHNFYGPSCIFIDFGSATSFGVVDSKGSFLGGCICPGMKLASEALVSGTSKLPHFELSMPDQVISRTTVTNLQSGLLYGYIGQVNYIVERMKEELGDHRVQVVATGGLALLVADRSQAIDRLDGLLTLKGLRIIYEKNT